MICGFLIFVWTYFYEQNIIRKWKLQNSNMLPCQDIPGYNCTFAVKSQASRLASVSEKAHFERATTVRYWPSESRWTDEWRADQPIKTLVRHHQKGPGERSETKAALPVNNPSQVNLHKHLTSSKQILFTKIFPSIHHQTSPNTSSWFVPFKKFINVGLFFLFSDQRTLKVYQYHFTWRQRTAAVFYWYV